MAISRDRWPDDVRLSDLEARFVCRACAALGADVRPDFNWDRKPSGQMAATDKKDVVSAAQLVCYSRKNALHGLTSCDANSRPFASSARRGDT